MEVSTGTTSNITSNSATVGGQIIDLGEGVTQHGHYYGKTTGVKNTGIKTTNGVPKGTISFTSELKNLEEGTTYYYQAYITDGNETTFGTELSFSTTPLAPTVTTTSATSVTNSTANINGTVNANNQSTTVTFDYGLTSSYGSTINATPNPVTGNTSTNVSASLTGLSEGTLYHFRVNAVSPGGTVNGDDLTFTTSINPINPPAYVSSVVENAAPAILEMTYNLTLANIVPAASAFTVMVNSAARAVSSVAISGTKVMLTLPIAIVHGDIVTVAYTKPASNPLQTASGGQAATIGAQTVTNNTLCSAPSATSNSATNLGTTTATLNGTVNANSFSTTVTFEYGTNTSYGSTITATQSPISGSSNTAVSAGIAGLTPNTLYHYKVKTVNCGGAIDGNDMTFASLASVTTNAISNITSTTALSGGSIASGGGEIITSRGVCWSETVNPTIQNFKTTDGTGTGNFTSNLAGLTPTTTYYVKAYATNSAGTNYGNQVSFKTDFMCSTRLMDARDGKTYLTVQIGNQCWFAENLNVGIRIDGSIDQANNGVIEKYCYNNNESNCSLYGGLYQWDEMMQYTTSEMSQGVCPVGWHIPSDYEWKVLEMTLGMDQTSANAAGWRGTTEGGKLKAAGTTYWNSPNYGATNSSLFTAMPSGDRSSTGTFESLGYFTDFWTSTFIIDTQCWYRYLDADHSQVYRIDGNRKYGTSVRCVKD